MALTKPRVISRSGKDVTGTSADSDERAGRNTPRTTTSTHSSGSSSNSNNEKAKVEFEQNGAPAAAGASIMPKSLPDAKSIYPEGDFRNHVDQGKSLVGKIRAKTYEANEKVSSHIPSYDDVIAKRDQLEKSNEAFGNKMQLIRDTAHKNKRVGSAVDKFATFGKGIYEEVDENPIGVGITTGSMFLGGGALKIGSTAGRMGLLRAASLAGSGSKVGRGLTITSNAIDPALAVGGVALTGHGLKGKSAEELGHITPHLAGGLAGGALGWRAASGASLKMEMGRGFNARYENPTSVLTQVNGPKNAVRPLNSEYGPLEPNARVFSNPATNELRIVESVRRGGQTVDSNAKFADPINEVSVLKPKDTSIRSEITVFEKGVVKPQKFQFEMEAPKTESVTIQKGRVKSQLEMEVPIPESPLNRVTAKRRNLRVEETPSKKSLWKDETAQLMTKGEVKPSTQFERPLFERGTSEVVPEKTMLFNTKMRSRVKTVVPLFSTSQVNTPIFDNEFVKEKDILKDKVQDIAKKHDTPTYTQVRQAAPLSSALTTSYSKPKTKERTSGGLARLNVPIPVVDVPTRNKSNRKIKPKKQKDSWKYKRTANKYKSPLDVKIKGGII